MASSSQLDDILGEFKQKFGYSMSELDPDCYYWVFQRTVERNYTHKLILEDHRWERGDKNFDPQRDIGDWLIFSMLIDEERDWFGRFVETQYPLTLEEYKLIEKIIHELEAMRDVDDEHM